jgi:hypothetical protein
MTALTWGWTAEKPPTRLMEKSAKVSELWGVAVLGQMAASHQTWRHKGPIHYPGSQEIDENLGAG